MPLFQVLEDSCHGKINRVLLNSSLVYETIFTHRYANAGDTPLAPTWDWVNRVPGLDNGENIWAIYGLIEALESTQRPDYISLAIQWQSYIDYLKSTVTKVKAV